MRQVGNASRQRLPYAGSSWPGELMALRPPGAARESAARAPDLLGGQFPGLASAVDGFRS